MSFSRRHKNRKKNKKSTKRWRRGKKKTPVWLASAQERAIGPSADRTGPRWLFFNLSLWTVRHPSLLSSTFHFMSALAATLTSCFSFFIMFVCSCTVLSAKALVGRKKPSQDQSKTQPGVTQTCRDRGEGGRWGGGTEVWGKGWERDWDGEGGKEGRPGVGQREERGVSEVVIEEAIMDPPCRVLPLRQHKGCMQPRH